MSFQIRNPIQQCANALARCCDALEGGLRLFVWGMGGMAIGVVLLAIIAFFRGPLL